MPSGPVLANTFVAVFDIIGFRALRERKGTAGLYQQFSRGILPGIQHSAAGRGKVVKSGNTSTYVPDFSKSNIGYKWISDTVIFHSSDDSFESFLNIVNSSFMLLQFGFSGGKAPYRGAIGWGDLIVDQNLLVGRAIEDAYIGEITQAWAGCMLTEACLGFVRSRNFLEEYRSIHLKIAEEMTGEREKRDVIENARRLVEYSVPTQSNPKDGPAIYSTLKTYTIDWTIRMYEGAGEKSFDQSSSLHAREIAKNTIAFEKWARANNK